MEREDITQILQDFDLLDLYRDMRAFGRGEKLSDESMARMGRALQLDIDGK